MIIMIIMINIKSTIPPATPSNSQQLLVIPSNS